MRKHILDQHCMFNRTAQRDDVQVTLALDMGSRPRMRTFTGRTQLVSGFVCQAVYSELERCIRADQSPGKPRLCDQGSCGDSDYVEDS